MSSDVCIFGAGALSKQANRRARVDLSPACVGARHRQRCQSAVQFVRDPQRLATRREHVQAREPSGELLDELGHRRHDVFAVVDHEQEIPVRQPAGERVHVGLTARALQPDLRGHLADDKVR